MNRKRLRDYLLWDSMTDEVAYAPGFYNRELDALHDAILGHLMRGTFRDHRAGIIEGQNRLVSDRRTKRFWRLFARRELKRHG